MKKVILSTSLLLLMLFSFVNTGVLAEELNTNIDLDKKVDNIVFPKDLDLEKLKAEAEAKNNAEDPIPGVGTFGGVNLSLYMGINAYKMGHYKEAAEYIEQSVESTPDNAFAYLCLGNAYYRLGLYDKATGSYMDAIEQSPRFVEAYYNLGQAYNKLGEKVNAQEAFKKVHQLQ